MATAGKLYVKTEESSDTVRLMSACGRPLEAMCNVLGIDDVTLRKHYKEELKAGSDIVHTEVVGHLLGKIRSGDTNAMIFWCRTRMGWAEKKEIHLSTPAATMLVLERIIQSLPVEFHERVKIATLNALNDVGKAEQVAELPATVIEAEFEDGS